MNTGTNGSVFSPFEGESFFHLKVFLLIFEVLFDLTFLVSNLMNHLW